MPRIKNEDIRRAEYMLGIDQVDMIKKIAARTKNSESGVVRRIVDTYFRGRSLEQVEAKLGY